MISKFGKMRDSWFAKAILTITALSFMSLFGVTGYINTANSNKTVIKVDGFELSQSEFNYLLQREMAKVKALTDDAEISDDLRAQVANGLLKTKLEDAVIDNTMKKHHIDFTSDLISSVILNMPQFAVKGKFDVQQYNWTLSRMGMTERELVANIKRDLARKILLDSQVAFAKVPEILRKQMQKVMGERRTFKYTKISAADIKVGRTPTDEELDQYYEDLKDEFTLPETRDVDLLYLSEADLEKNIRISDEEIQAYYKEHIDEYEQPEKRFVLQMVFDDAKTAQEAHDRIIAGEDFTAVAADFKQQKEDVELGYVAPSDLVPELAQKAFTLADGAVSEPLEINGSWQVIKVNGIQQAKKTDEQKAYAEIEANLKQERVYDGSYELVSAMEDQIGGGTDLAEIAQAYNVGLRSVNGLTEEEAPKNVSSDLVEVLQDKDVLEEIFSYNEGEITKVLETNQGIVVARITAIHAPHLMPREEAETRLREIWLENEKNSVVQELVDNLEHDFESGDDLPVVAKRYNLLVKNTMPVTRAENFDDLPYETMRELFSLPKNYASVVKVGDDYIAAETTNIYDDAASLSDNDKQFLDEALVNEMAEEMSEALLKDFASDYQVEVNYNRAGLAD